jgi:hypothetical protein
MKLSVRVELFVWLVGIPLRDMVEWKSVSIVYGVRYVITRGICKMLQLSVGSLGCPSYILDCVNMQDMVREMGQYTWPMWAALERKSLSLVVLMKEQTAMMTVNTMMMLAFDVLIHHAMKATSSVFPMKKVFISSVYQTAICVIHSKTVLMDMMK